VSTSYLFHNFEICTAYLKSFRLVENGRNSLTTEVTVVGLQCRPALTPACCGTSAQFVVWSDDLLLLLIGTIWFGYGDGRYGETGTTRSVVVNRPWMTGMLKPHASRQQDTPSVDRKSRGFPGDFLVTSFCLLRRPSEEMINDNKVAGTERRVAWRDTYWSPLVDRQQHGQ